MSMLEAQQIHAGLRQRSVVQRQQQQQARREEAAAAAAPQQQEQQQQLPGPQGQQQQQQQPGPRRSGRVAQQQAMQQARQQAPDVLRDVFAPAPPPVVHPRHKAALHPVVEGLGFPKHDLGPRTLQCSFCHAKLWPQENKGGAAAPRGGMLCCNGGKSCSIQDSFQQPPQLIRELFTSTSTDARRFRKHARLYNSALQMASSGLVDIAPQQGGPSMIAIRGAVHHLLGPLVPAQGRPPQFAQLYIIDDPEQQVQSRIEALGQAGPDLDADLLRQIQDCLHTHNTYVQQFKQNMVSQDWVNRSLLYKWHVTFVSLLHIMLT